MGLSAIAEKPAVISTFGTDALSSSAERVRSTYEWIADTYVEQPSISGWQSAFLNAVRERKTPKASIVAPFGYGKSATAIGVWQACKAAGILAVPPLACSSFAEIAYAVCDWLTYRLDGRRADIADMRERFLVGSADVLARRDEREFAIPYDQALAAIQDKLERGYLDFEDVSINLLALLESATTLAEQAGFAGLVVILDEGQQLIGNAGKGVLVALRQLVWGLRTRKLPLGLLITLDPDTERTLADRAGDILHRVKDDGLYLDIREVYGREFPARLWHQYAAAFELNEADRATIDRPTLDALGQLCEREDLSNGPRTVVDVLQHAAARRSAGAPPGYSPVQLVDDLVRGEIRFAGDRNTLPALVSELLSYGYFQRDAERSAALKLLAAFPRGCPPEIVRHYGLEAAVGKLDADLRGEVITELEEGLALIELQRVARPANRLNQLLRRYWMQITDEELFAEDAPKTFAETVIPLLFSAKQNDLNGWAALEPVRLAADGTYRALFEGTGSLDFPLRRIGVCVLPETVRDPDRPDDLDYWIVFRIATTRGTPTLLVDAKEGAFTWHLPLTEEAPYGLDAGLRWIEHYLNPHPISAATVLSLLRYLERESAVDGDARDNARITDTLERLRAWLLARIFDEDTFRRAGHAVSQSGIGALSEFLYGISRARWPAYRPVAMQRNWLSLLDDYVGAIVETPVPVRTGESLLSGTKSEVAALFGQERHAGFDSRARQYGPLLEMVSWKGERAEVRFAALGAELQLATELRARGGWSRTDAYSSLRRDGYSSAEAAQIIRLGTARGVFIAENGRLLPPAMPQRAEIVARVRLLLNRLQGHLPQLCEEADELRAIETTVEYQTDPSWRLDQIERKIEAADTATRAAEQARLSEEHALLLKAAAELRVLPAAPAGDLKAHLSAAHTRLEEQRSALALVVRAAADGANADAMRAARMEVVKYAPRAEEYRRWIDLARRARVLITVGSPETRDRAKEFVARARETLAVGGLPALSHISLLELDLVEIERGHTDSEGAEDARARRAAALLTAQITSLLNLPSTTSLPSESTLASVHATVADRLLRGLYALRLDAQSAERRKLRRVNADLDSVITLLQSDQSRAFTESGDCLAPEVVAAVQKVRSALNGTALSRTTTVLSRSLQEGPTDLLSTLQQGEGLDLEASLAEVVALARQGLIRLTVDIPEKLVAPQTSL